MGKSREIQAARLANRSERRRSSLHCRGSVSWRSSARNRSATRSKEARLRTAQAKADDKYAEMQELEADLVEELEEINDRWEEKGEQIDQVEVGLEKSDIQIIETALVWLPTG